MGGLEIILCYFDIERQFHPQFGIFEKKKGYSIKWHLWHLKWTYSVIGLIMRCKLYTKLLSTRSLNSLGIYRKRKINPYHHPSYRLTLSQYIEIPTPENQITNPPHLLTLCPYIEISLSHIKKMDGAASQSKSQSKTASSRNASNQAKGDKKSADDQWQKRVDKRTGWVNKADVTVMIT